jgi:hypothetical protein
MMTDEMKELIDEVNELGCDFTMLDRVKDAARVRSIQARITEIELGFLGMGPKETAYFPLLKTNNINVPYEEFYDILIDVLVGLFRTYNSAHSTFTTALSYQLNHRIIDYFRKIERNRELLILDEADEDESTLVEKIADTAAAQPDQYSEDKEEESELEVLVRLVALVGEMKKKDAHLVEKLWFERFFTFDVTKMVKTDSLCAERAVAKNDLLFPIMELVLLEFLMHGAFTHISDVIANELKDERYLNQRNEVIQKCYHVSKPTVCSHNAKYYEVFKQACGF